MSLTGGAGNDTFKFSDSNISSITDIESLSKSLVTIQDFEDAKVDTLSLKKSTTGTDEFVTQSVVNDAITGLANDANLFDVVSAVAEP